MLNIRIIVWEYQVSWMRQPLNYDEFELKETHWSVRAQSKLLMWASTAQRKHGHFAPVQRLHQIKFLLATMTFIHSLWQNPPPRTWIIVTPWDSRRAPGHRPVFKSIKTSWNSLKLSPLTTALPQVRNCRRNNQAAEGLQPCLVTDSCNHHCEIKFLHQTALAILLPWVAEDYLVWDTFSSS
jgi:hypothetical protein